MIYDTVEDHKPGGVRGDNLRQNPGGRGYLLIPALIGYQAVKDLLPDVLPVLGCNTLLAPLTRIASHAVQLSGADGGAIYEYDEATREFQLRGSHQIEKELVDALRAIPIQLGGGWLAKRR